jgi:hypothetical protein
MARTAEGPFVKDAKDRTATLMNFSWDDLAPFTRAGEFPADDSPDFRVFYVGRDDVHSILKYLLSRSTRALKMNMFGYDDDELNTVIETLVEDQQVYVQGTLDKSQAGGVHEKKILDDWKPSMRASFAVGESATHQISHTKGGTIDGIVAWEGSTNWSASGEGTGVVVHSMQPAAAGFKAQNNTLAVYTNPVEILKFSTELDEEHTTALHQQQQALEAAADKTSTPKASSSKASPPRPKSSRIRGSRSAS